MLSRKLLEHEIKDITFSLEQVILFLPIHQENYTSWCLSCPPLHCQQERYRTSKNYTKVINGRGEFKTLFTDMHHASEP